VTAAPRDVPEDERARRGFRRRRLVALSKARRGRAFVHAQGWKKR